jgi:hypothetical protein
LFSAVIIFLGNALILLLAIPLLADQVSTLAALHWWAKGTMELLQKLIRLW